MMVDRAVALHADFQPINEGLVIVHAHNASLTSLGEAIAVLSRHQGQRLLRLPSADAHGGGEGSSGVTMPPGIRVAQLPATSTADPEATDLAVLASMDDATSTLRVTAINGHAAVRARVRVAVDAPQASRKRRHSGVEWKATLLRAAGITPTTGARSHGSAGWFEPERAHEVDTAEAGYVAVVVPPYSLVQLRSVVG